MMRLISFLGTGNYSETTYTFENKTCRTRFVAQALAAFTQPKEIHLIATTEAWDEHGATLVQELLEAGHPSPVLVSIPKGGIAQQLWEMFGTIVDAIRTSSFPIIFDITHGFRMQPFFAAACIQYVQAVVPNVPTIRVVYGEYRKTEKESPIWELTPFLEVLFWSRNLMLFLRTGQANEVVAQAETLGRELKRQWATSGRPGTQPKIYDLAKAIKAFSDDLTTVRTGSLLIGHRPSAQLLCDAIDQTSVEVAKQLPALELILDQVRDMVEPLCLKGARLSSVTGQRALLTLAKLYQKMGRYSEALSILREGWITLGGPATIDQPGSDEFDNDSRSVQEQVWRLRTEQSRNVSEVRNDIQHAGFNKQPHDRRWFEEQLTKLLNHWQDAIDTMHTGNME